MKMGTTEAASVSSKHLKNKPKKNPGNGKRTMPEEENSLPETIELENKTNKQSNKQK